jgi:hypothetical protein
VSYTDPNGSKQCLIFAPAIMDVLKVTPPFFYTYQCGSTILISYIPINMYSISIQILSTIGTLVIIFSSPDSTEYPRWLFDLLPGVCWPTHWHSARDSDADLKVQPKNLIKPYQIISRMMNNFILLFSFGLCSPVLCCFIVVCICVHFFSWLVLIGRFVMIRRSAPRQSSLVDEGSLISLSFSSICCLEALNHDHEMIEDPILLRLDEELQGVSSSLLVCKWPVTIVSCLFLSLLCCDMVGDQGGWLQALFVLIAGVVMAYVIQICDRMLISRLPQNCSPLELRFRSSFPKDHHNADSDSLHSLEFVHSSFHPSGSQAETKALPPLVS